MVAVELGLNASCVNVQPPLAEQYLALWFLVGLLCWPCSVVAGEPMKGGRIWRLLGTGKQHIMAHVRAKACAGVTVTEKAQAICKQLLPAHTHAADVHANICCQTHSAPPVARVRCMHEWLGSFAAWATVLNLTAKVCLRGAMPVKCRYVIKAPQLNAAARSSTGGSTMQAGGELSTSGVFPA